MAFGGQKDSISNNLCCVTCNDLESTAINADNCGMNEHSSFPLKKDQEFVNVSELNIDDVVCCNMDDPTQNDDFDDCSSDKNADDVNQSSDSLSSSASISDSDLTSTDSEDSLALSESESITDVTPLNSPYCDSPQPQSRHIEYKPEDKPITNQCRNVEYDGSGDNCHRPEMNVLMKAIEKLELEAKSNSECGFRENLMRRRATSFSNEESKKIEQENQRLFKRVISQQNRMRSIYSSSNQPGGKNISSKHQEIGKSAGDISGAPKKSLVGKAEKSNVHRKQKCLSHPSSFMYSCNHIDKNVLADGLSPERNEKKKYVNSPVMKIASCSQKSENMCEDVSSSPEAN